MTSHVDFRDPTTTRIPWPQDREFEQMDWRPPKEHIIVSADDHVMEPVHLWEDRMPARYKDWAPKLWRDDAGYHLEVEGRSFDSPGFNSQLIEGREGIHDPALRLADMDGDLVDISIAFPQRGLALFYIRDADKLMATVDVYNEWFAEWCGQFDGRVIGVGILPTILRPEATREYLQRLKSLGFKAIMLPSYPRGIKYNSQEAEQIFDAIEESGLPLSFHVGEAGEQSTGHGALLTYITAQLQSFRKLWCTLVFSGILERHPDLKVIFTEGGASWAASALYDADNVYRAYETETRPKLARLPSFYWRQNCYATFMDDTTAYREVDRIGADKIMWSVDYPHPEGTLGYGRRVLKEIYDSVSEADARKIVGQNAVDVWGLQETADRILAARGVEVGKV